MSSKWISKLLQTKVGYTAVSFLIPDSEVQAPGGTLSSIINDVGGGGGNRGFEVQWLSKPLVCILIQEKVQYLVLLGSQDTTWGLLVTHLVREKARWDTFHIFM